MKDDIKLYGLISLVADVESKELGKRILAMEEIKKFPKTQIIENCKHIFQDTNNEHSRSIIVEIATQADPNQALPLILELLKAQKHVFRQDACMSLLNVDPEKSIGYFIQVLRNDPHPDVRYHAIRALGTIGNKQALEPLQQTFLHDDGIANDYNQDIVFEVPLRQAAQIAIQKINQRLSSVH